MPEQPQPQPNYEPVHADVGYEKAEPVLRAPVAAGIGVIVLILLAYGVSTWAFDALKARAARRDPGLSPLAAAERPQLPQGIDKIPPQGLDVIPEPRLEVKEGPAVETQRKAEDQLLDGRPTWIDPNKGTVRIPIADAMRLLADPEIARAKGIRVESPKGGAQ